MKKNLFKKICLFLVVVIVASNVLSDIPVTKISTTTDEIAEEDYQRITDASTFGKVITDQNGNTALVSQYEETEETVEEKGILSFLYENVVLKVASFFGSSVFRGEKAYAEEEDTKIVFFDNTASGNPFVDQGAVLDMNTNRFNLAVARVHKSDSTDAAFAAGTEISFSVTTGEGSVVSLAPDTNLNDNWVTVNREGPGRAIIAVAITENGQTRYATITIHVEFKLVMDDVEWKDTGLSGYSQKVLFLDQREYITNPLYKLKIQYMDDTDINADSIVVVDNRDYDESVVKYSEGQGGLLVRGAGYTTVTLSTTGSTPDKISFNVLVEPVGSFTQGAPLSGGQTDCSTYQRTCTTPGGVPITEDHFSIYTNASKATNLTWTVYSVNKNGDLQEISKSDHSKLTYNVSNQSGVVNFENVKAGTYRIISEANVKFSEDESRNRTVYDVVVMLSLEDKELLLNVGDTYDLLGNSNIPVDLFEKLYDISFEETTMKNYADIDKRTGVITAKAVGVAKIKFKYKSGSASTVLPEPWNSSIGDVVYTINVIDYLSINNASLTADGSSEFTMYAGGEYPLYASITNRDYDVYWESLDESIATVTENGNGSVMVQARKKGTVTIRAYQIINGIEKNAYATIHVKNTATKVTLDPAKLDIEVGDYKTVVAQFTGDSTNLTWVSSDETVFNFVDGVNVGTSATIQALKPGSAILTAINPANIVCGYCEVTVFQEVTGIKISENTLTLKEDAGTYQMYATLQPANASDSSVLWSSTKPDVVSVDANGKLTIKKEGECTIIVQSVLNPEFYATCTVKVLQGVSGISLDSKKLELYRGETYRLPYVISPKDASDDAINITLMDNTGAINVSLGEDHTLLVKANKVGRTTFMIMTRDGKYFDTCEVTVKQPATAVKSNYSDITLNVGEFFDMGVTITPADATEASLKWESLDPSVATVSQSGRVVGVSVGKTSVAISTPSGAFSFFTVNVLAGATKIELDETEITIETGDTYTLYPEFTPETTSNKACIWTSDKPDVATVDATGKITALKGGVAIITCEAVDGGYRAFCRVNVEELVRQITLDPESYILGKGKMVQIHATVTNGETASNTELIWYSDDESVATVDELGRITGVDYGTTVVYCEAAEGEARAKVNIEVVREVTQITLNSTYETIIVGHNFKLTATVAPKNANYKNVKYTSSDESIAIVDEDGVITGVKKGEAWITASAMDNSGKTAKCYVNVINPVSASGVTLSDTELALMPGEKKSVTTRLTPANSTDKLAWSTSNDYIASVDENGEITANNVGTTTIKVMTTSGKSATINVTVLGLSRTYIEIPVYTTYRLYVDGTNETIRWDVDDLSVLDVENGTITARKACDQPVRVTARVHGRTLECLVKVTKK